MALEAEAREAGLSVSALLDRIAGEWLLAKKNSRVNDREEQARLHAAAEEVIGTISAGRHYAENVRTVIRNKLRKRYAR
jgi:hypothetical protein